MRLILRALILACIFLTSQAAHAISETEPNDSFAVANGFSEGASVTGTVGDNLDVDDYFVSLPNDDGTIELSLNYDNISGSTDADLIFYIYDKSKSEIAKRLLYNRPLGAGSDTIRVYCRMQDTVYFRVYANGAISYDFSYSTITSGVSDSESNDDFSSANGFQHTDTVKGRVGYRSVNTDEDDYFYSVLPDDGTLNLYIAYNNISNSTGSDLVAYIYNKDNVQLGRWNFYNEPLGLSYDTLTVHCRSEDTVYFRIEATAGCFSYQFHYDVTPSGERDQEPNDAFSQAYFFNYEDTIHGRIGYRSVATDKDDYFYSVLPDDGTLKLYLEYINTSASTGADLVAYIYNKDHVQIERKNFYNEPLVLTYDSLTVHCRSEDTVYFRIEAPAGCFSYQLSYDVIPSGERDQEPNGSIAQATLFNSNDTVRGRVGYRSVEKDGDDYFYSVLPDDGTLKLYVEYNNTSGSTDADLVAFIYNKDGVQIDRKNFYNEPLGLSNDSLTVHCRTADTVYFRIASYTYCFSYIFYYKVIPSGHRDLEPNNLREEAAAIDLSDTLSGRVGYTSVVRDKEDFFSFFNAGYSSIVADLRVFNTSSGSFADFEVDLYNSKNNNVFTRNYYNQDPGLITDTLPMSCLPQDTFYLRIRALSGCFSYELSFERVAQQPEVEILAANTGSIYGLEAVVNPQTDAISWDLGDGTSSSLKFIKKNYAIGNYGIILTGSNQACNLTVRDTLPITVKGIEYYTPGRAGEGGDVIMQVFGGGLDTFTQVVLTDPNGNTLEPLQKWARPDGTELHAFFDLHFADPGIYDVDITIPGEPTASYPEGFVVEGFEYPYTLSYITGPDRWRTNRKTRFILNVTNRGNVNASGVVAYMVWPKSVEVEFDTEWFRPPESGSYFLDLEDTILEFDYADIQSFYDSSFMTPTPIDSFAGEPYDGYAFSIMIGAIPPGSIYEIPFYAESENPSNITFETYTIKPNLFGSGGSTSQNDMWENGAVEAIDAIDFGLGLFKADKTPVGWLVKGVKATTTHMANLGQAMGAASLVADGTHDNIYQAVPAGYDANVAAGNWQTSKAILDIGIDKAVDAGADRILKGHQERVNKWVLGKKNPKLNSALLASDQLQTVNDIRQFVKDAYSQGKNAKWVGEKLDRLAKAAEDCPELQKQIEELKKNQDKDLHKRDKRKKRTRSVNSMDPNAIYGPAGVDSFGYIQPDYRHSFIAMFENIDTASADAQIVTLSVPIDTQAYDLSTFSFGDVTIGGHVFDIPENRQSFVTDVSVPYRPGITIRVLGYLENGVAYWRFTSLDNTTQELPLLEGFLPPNAIVPQGEGSVEFAVSLKDEVKNGRTIATQASIIFDNNKPIMTNTWYNTVDKTSGSSNVSVSVDNQLVRLDLSGYDSLSGIGYYNIYFSENGGEWIAMGGTSEDTFTIAGLPGVTYGIYVESVDRVGNEESKPASAEATVTITGVEKINSDQRVMIIPNPSDGNFKIKAMDIKGPVWISIHNLTGQEIYRERVEFNQNTSWNIDLSNKQGSMFLLRMETSDQQVYHQKLVKF